MEITIFFSGAEGMIAEGIKGKMSPFLGLQTICIVGKEMGEGQIDIEE